MQKIYACEAKRPSMIKINWAHLQDLHVTIAYIRGVADTDTRLLGTHFLTLAKNASFMARVTQVKLYGSALVLCLDPYNKFHAMHKLIKVGLKDCFEGKYSLEDNKRFDPHMTIGRLLPGPHIGPQQKFQFTNMIQEQFANFGFMVQQAGLMRRKKENTLPHYELLHPYNLSR